MNITRRRSSSIIIKGTSVLLVHRVDGKADYWTFPGGGIEANETPEQAIKREVREETSLSVIECLVAFEDIDIFASTHNTFFFCKTSGDSVVLGGPESRTQSPTNRHLVEWVQIEEIGNLKLVPKTSKDKFLEFYKTRILPGIPVSLG